jgi:hypothetical protein
MKDLTNKPQTLTIGFEKLKDQNQNFRKMKHSHKG